MRLLRILLLCLVLVDNCLGSESNFQWTPHLEDELRKIYHHARLSGQNPQQRMKVEWDQQFPMYSHLDSDSLWQHVQTLLQTSRINKGKRKNMEFFEWEPESRVELVKIYHDSDSGASNHSGRIYKEWIKRHKELAYMEPAYLVKKARSFMNESEKNEIRKWTEKLDQELLRTYYNNGRRSKELHKDWISKHTKFRNISPEKLIKRAWYLDQLENKKKGIKNRNYFRWSKELKADLLHIYRRTEKDDGKHWERVWECWREMHPNLTDVGLNQLQVQRKNLSRLEYKPSEEDEKKARERFDVLSTAHLYEHNSTEAPPKRSHRKGKRVSSPARDLPSTSQHHHDDYDQYKDMPMFSPLPYEDFYDDPHQYMDPTLLGHTLHEDPYPHFHNQDERRG